MSEDKVGLPIPDFKAYSLESFGQVIKASEFLEPEVFPYQVSVRKDSAFFKSAYDRVYRGKGVTVGALKNPKRRALRGRAVEHMALLAVNDVGELLVGKEVYEGNFFQSLTKHSGQKFHEYRKILQALGLPPGWRKIGDIHSHPATDVINTVGLSFSNVPKANDIPVTWSGGDFKSVVTPIFNGRSRAEVSGVITPVQLSFTVTTAKTLRLLGEKSEKVKKLLETKYDLPPYNNFEELGIILYAGNHRGRGEAFTLQRLI